MMESLFDKQSSYYGSAKQAPPMLPHGDDPHAVRAPKRRKRVKDCIISVPRQYEKPADNLFASSLPQGFPEECSFRALAAYSLLRTLSIQLGLAPFSPLAFLRSIYLNVPSSLSGDIHVALLRTLLSHLRMGYHFGDKNQPPLDVKKRRKIDGIAWPLRAGDNLALLDMISWPVFYDDYCHLTADIHYRALNDDTLWVDSRRISSGHYDSDSEEAHQTDEAEGRVAVIYPKEQVESDDEFEQNEESDFDDSSVDDYQATQKGSRSKQRSNKKRRKMTAHETKVPKLNSISVPAPRMILPANMYMSHGMPYNYPFRNQSAQVQSLNYTLQTGFTALPSEKRVVPNMVDSRRNPVQAAQDVRQSVHHHALPQPTKSGVHISPLPQPSIQVSSPQPGKNPVLKAALHKPNKVQQNPALPNVTEPRPPQVKPTVSPRAHSVNIPVSAQRLVKNEDRGNADPMLSLKTAAGQVTGTTVQGFNALGSSRGEKSVLAKSIEESKNEKSLHESCFVGLSAIKTFPVPSQVQQKPEKQPSPKMHQDPIDRSISCTIQAYIQGKAGATQVAGDKQAAESRKQEGCEEASSIDTPWPHFEPLRKMREGTPYHQLGLLHKLDILEFLLDEVLMIGAIASEMTARHEASLSHPVPFGRLPSESDLDEMYNDDFCNVCHQEGDLICCDGCVGSYHRLCVGLPAEGELPEGKWYCPECTVLDPAMFGPLKGGRKACIEWADTAELKAACEYTSSTPVNSSAEAQDVSPTTSIVSTSIKEPSKSPGIQYLCIHGFLFVRENRCTMSTPPFPIAKENMPSHFALIGRDVCSGWPLAQIPAVDATFKDTQALPASGASYLNRMENFNPWHYNNKYAVALSRQRKGSFHESLSSETDRQWRGKFPIIELWDKLRVDTSIDHVVRQAAARGTSLFNPYSILRSLMLDLFLRLVKAGLLHPQWGVGVPTSKGLKWKKLIRNCRSVPRLAALFVRLVDAIEARAFDESWFSCARTKTTWHEKESQSDTVHYSRTCDTKALAKLRSWETCPIGSMHCFLAKEGYSLMEWIRECRPDLGAEIKVKKRKYTSLPKVEKTEGLQTGDKVTDTSEAQPTKRLRSSKYSLAGRNVVDAGDIEECLRQARKQKFSDVADSVAGLSVREQMWPIAGRKFFPTVGSLPSSVTRFLARNAGAVEAPYVTYADEFEVGQIPYASVWKKRMMSCSTFSEFVFLARCLESNIDGAVVRKTTSLTHRYNSGRNLPNTKAVCNYRHVPSGTTEHLVVKMRQELGHWVLNSSLELPTFVQHQIERSNLESVEKTERYTLPTACKPDRLDMFQVISSWSRHGKQESTKRTNSSLLYNPEPSLFGSRSFDAFTPSQHNGVNSMVHSHNKKRSSGNLNNTPMAENVAPTGRQQGGNNTRFSHQAKSFTPMSQQPSFQNDESLAVLEAKMAASLQDLNSLSNQRGTGSQHSSLSSFLQQHKHNRKSNGSIFPPQPSQQQRNSLRQNINTNENNGSSVFSSQSPQQPIDVLQQSNHNNNDVLASQSSQPSINLLQPNNRRNDNSVFPTQPPRQSTDLLQQNNRNNNTIFPSQPPQQHRESLSPALFGSQRDDTANHSMQRQSLGPPGNSNNIGNAMGSIQTGMQGGMVPHEAQNSMNQFQGNNSFFPAPSPMQSTQMSSVLFNDNSMGMNQLQQLNQSSASYMPNSFQASNASTSLHGTSGGFGIQRMQQMNSQNFNNGYGMQSNGFGNDQFAQLQQLMNNNNNNNNNHANSMQPSYNNPMMFQQSHNMAQSFSGNGFPQNHQLPNPMQQQMMPANNGMNFQPGLGAMGFLPNQQGLQMNQYSNANMNSNMNNAMNNTTNNWNGANNFF